jgi:cytochrome P450
LIETQNKKAPKRHRNLRGAITLALSGSSFSSLLQMIRGYVVRLIKARQETTI